LASRATLVVLADLTVELPDDTIAAVDVNWLASTRYPRTRDA